jgi:hypothetical protein
MPDDNTYDVHLPLLAELLHVLDGHYQRIERAIRESPDPDSFGEFDRGEHLIGLAFVACQTYIAATCGRFKVAKREALDVGASMAGDLTAARLVNHAANFWKHHREPDDRSAGGVAQRNSAVFAAIGVAQDADYSLSNVLGKLLPNQEGIASLEGLMVEWRHELDARRRRTNRRLSAAAGEGA